MSYENFAHALEHLYVHPLGLNGEGPFIVVDGSRADYEVDYPGDSISEVSHTTREAAQQEMALYIYNLATAPSVVVPITVSNWTSNEKM